MLFHLAPRGFFKKDGVGIFLGILKKGEAADGVKSGGLAIFFSVKLKQVRQREFSEQKIEVEKIPFPATASDCSISDFRSSTVFGATVRY